MYVQVEKPKENKSRAIANSVAQKKSSEKQGFGFVDNRPETVAQKKLQQVVSNRRQAKHTPQLQAMESNHYAQQQQVFQKKENTDASEVVQRVVYNSLADVKNNKFLPTSGQYTDNQKLDIANWCANNNDNSNSIKSAYHKEYAYIYSTVTGNDKEFVFTFMWNLALHIDLGGAAHGGVDTPHLQAVSSLKEKNGKKIGSTKAKVIIEGNATDGRANEERSLTYNSKDNAVFIGYTDTKKCMDAGNLDPVKEKIQDKIKAFSKEWGRNYSDKCSGAKDERAQESDDDLDFSLFD